jgi:flagellar M-ring protein FliF
MEPLFKQLRELPGRFSALPPNMKRLTVFGALALAAIAIGAMVIVNGTDGYQYVFTNLTTEDSAEAAATLKAAKIPFRLEAGGAALAAPASQVYDARLLLASAGLPRGGGVGFEIFDRGDLGVSEFTQKVNFRRAIEGDLARTVGHLAEVRSARIHLTLPEKGLFRDDERKGSAAVVLNLHPGRSVGEKELAGIRHLVASAVPGLMPEAVTIVDASGGVLSAQRSWGEQAQSFEHDLERDLEARVVGLLEPVVGAGSVVARVSAAVDSAEVDTQQEAWDPDQVAVRSERKVTQAQSQDSTSKGGLTGAAANQPLAAAAPAAGGSGSRGNSSTEEEVKNYEIGKTVTKTTARAPRLKRLSVAILVDGVDGKPRAAEEVQRLGELVKKAVGFDLNRGDQIEISSAVFTRSNEVAPVEPPAPFALKPIYLWAAGGAAVLILLVIFAVALLRRRPAPLSPEVLRPGSRVGDLLAGRVNESGGLPSLPAAQNPAATIQERARELAAKDPVRTAHLLKAWMAGDQTEAKS